MTLLNKEGHFFILAGCDNIFGVKHIQFLIK